MMKIKKKNWPYLSVSLLTLSLIACLMFGAVVGNAFYLWVQEYTLMCRPVFLTWSYMVASIVSIALMAWCAMIIKFLKKGMVEEEEVDE